MSHVLYTGGRPTVFLIQRSLLGKKYISLLSDCACVARSNMWNIEVVKIESLMMDYADIGC